MALGERGEGENRGVSCCNTPSLVFFPSKVLNFCALLVSFGEGYVLWEGLARRFLRLL